MCSLLTIVWRLASTTLLILVTGLISACKTQGDKCYYYYIQQPSSDTACNPWPYISSYSGNNLVLHCDLLGPQNNDILSVVWYREIYTEDDDDLRPQRLIYSSSVFNGKFNSPNSSGDIAHGFKRLNFTLFVNNVSDVDAGCYWCEIFIHARNCSIRMKKSSVFCLQKKRFYGNMESCPILPVNSSVLCAASSTCNGMPANWTGDPYQIIDDDHKGVGMSKQVSTPSEPLHTNLTEPPMTNYLKNTEVSSEFTHSNSIRLTSSLLACKQLAVKTRSLQPTTSSNHHLMLSRSSTLTVPKATIIVSESFKKLMTTNVLKSTFRHSIAVAVTSTSDTKYSVITSASFSPSSLPTLKYTSGKELASVVLTGAGSDTTTNITIVPENLQLNPVQIGIFIGIAVCAILFAIISMLVFGVVMLCRKTEPRTQSRSRRYTHEGGHQPTYINGHMEPFSTAWRNEAGIPLPTSIVNSGHFIPPGSEPTYSDIPATVSNEGEEDGNPFISQPIASLPTLLNISSRWKTHSLPLLPDRRASINRGHQLSQNCGHHASSLLEGDISRGFSRRSRGSVALRSRSPDLHYYHVLERPEYYNCNWVEDEEGDRTDVSPTEDANGGNQKVEIQGDESDSDSLYHWKVVLTSSTREGQDQLDKNSSSKRVGRHLYRRLDHSTLEPLQDYAKVSIGQHNSQGEDSNA